MANSFMSGLKNTNNYTYTENGALTYKSTMNGLLDLFGMGGAYRNRSDADVITLFKNAFKEDETYALKCLFYLRDVRGGQGERRFFRTVIKWLARENTRAIERNLEHIPLFGRWDDLYEFVGTPLESAAFTLMYHQLQLDVQSKTPSLLAKWLKSENTSSRESRFLANKTREYFNMSHKEYRKTLSILRERIRVLERLMSAGRWDEIEFDKIPSRAGMIYKNAFARHDLERMKSEKNVQTYADFAKDKNTKVNAKALYPYEVVKKAMEYDGAWGYYYNHGYKDQDLNNTDRLMINKYWDSLKELMDSYAFNGLAVVDTSGSMYGDPLAVAISLGMYCAEHTTGPFANHFFTFSSNPNFIEIQGADFVDKVKRVSGADWGGSTNVEAVFDEMLTVAKANHCSQDEIPKQIIILSDMEFDSCVVGGARNTSRWGGGPRADETLFETIERRWNAAGYRMPLITFWNLDARQNNIPMSAKGHVQFVSGFSQNLFDQVMKGKTAYTLMFDKLNEERYACIH